MKNFNYEYVICIFQQLKMIQIWTKIQKRVSVSTHVAEDPVVVGRDFGPDSRAVGRTTPETPRGHARQIWNFSFLQFNFGKYEKLAITSNIFVDNGNIFLLFILIKRSLLKSQFPKLRRLILRRLYTV